MIVDGFGERSLKFATRRKATYPRNLQNIKDRRNVLKFQFDGLVCPTGDGRELSVFLCLVVFYYVKIIGEHFKIGGDDRLNFACLPICAKFVVFGQ